MKRIESSTNPFIKKVASLKQKKHRDKERIYVTEGLRISEDLLNDKEKNALVKSIILTEDNENLVSAEPFSFFKEKIVIISNKLEKDLTDTVNSQGVFLVVEKENLDLDQEIKKYSRILILDGVSDPGNMGTIVRTALAAKFDGIVSLRGSVDMYSPKVIRSTMGAINKIDIYDSFHDEELFSFIKESDFKVFAGDIIGEKTIFDSFTDEKIALVMGSEAQGIKIPEAYIDMKITVPMSEKSESLNVSVACGLLMYAINKSKFEK